VNRIVSLTVIGLAVVGLGFAACNTPAPPGGWPQIPNPADAPVPEPTPQDCSGQPPGGPSPGLTWQDACQQVMDTATIGEQILNAYYCNPLPGLPCSSGGGGQSEIPVCIGPPGTGGYVQLPDRLIDKTALDDGIVIVTDLNGENPVEMACPEELPPQ
jgi:hypothetical protein